MYGKTSYLISFFEFYNSNCVTTNGNKNKIIQKLNCDNFIYPHCINFVGKKTVLNYHRLKRIIYDEHLKHLLDGRQQKEKGQAKNKMAKNSREQVKKKIKLSWKTVVAKIKDRTGWKDCVAVLCATSLEKAQV